MIRCFVALIMGLPLGVSGGVLAADPAPDPAAGPAAESSPDPVTPTPAREDGAALPCAPLGPDTKVHIDLKDTPLSTVARLVSCATDRNIMFSPPALGAQRVNVLGPSPVGRRALVALWHTLLDARGLVWERHGAYEVISAP